MMMDTHKHFLEKNYSDLFLELVIHLTSNMRIILLDYLIDTQVLQCFKLSY
jgi:hypothetical protein